MDHIIDLLLGPASSLVLCLIVIWSGAKPSPWWVTNREHKETMKERDEWKDAALRGTRVAEKAVSIHEKK